MTIAGTIPSESAKCLTQGQHSKDKSSNTINQGSHHKEKVLYGVLSTDYQSTIKSNNYLKVQSETRDLSVHYHVADC